MSRAFVKEDYDDEWLSDISPTLNALILYLIRQNSGIPVYEKRVYTNTNNQEVHEMSNGLSYLLNADRKWQVADEL